MGRARDDTHDERGTDHQRGVRAIYEVVMGIMSGSVGLIENQPLVCEYYNWRLRLSDASDLFFD